MNIVDLIFRIQVHVHVPVYIRIKNDLKYMYMCIILTELLAEYISINIFVSSTK